MSTPSWLYGDRAKKVVPLVFYILLVIFLYLYLRSIDWAKLHNLHVLWSYLMLASTIGLVSRYWSILVWLVLLWGLGARDLMRSLRQLMYVYAKSWLGRYIPGTAPWILGKIYFASRHGIPKEKLAVSSLLEGALQIVVLLVISFGMLLFDARFGVINGDLRLLLAGITVLCLVALAPPVFNWFVSQAYRLIRHRPLDRGHLASGATIARGALLYAGGALLNGLSFFFITKSLDAGLSYHNLLFVMGASNLAGALGMLAIFIPSGIGVREGVQLVLLSAIMPKEIALVVVVVSRVWSVAVDLLFFGLGWLTEHAGRVRHASA